MMDSQGPRVCCICQKPEPTPIEVKIDEFEGDEADFDDEGDFVDEGDEGDEGEEGDAEELVLHQTNMQFHNKYTCKCGGWCFVDHGRTICALCSH
jgi:hypothetical protein